MIMLAKFMFIIGFYCGIIGVGFIKSYNKLKNDKTVVELITDLRNVGIVGLISGIVIVSFSILLV